MFWVIAHNARGNFQRRILRQSSLQLFFSSILMKWAKEFASLELNARWIKTKSWGINWTRRASARQTVINIINKWILMSDFVSHFYSDSYPETKTDETFVVKTGKRFPFFFYCGHLSLYPVWSLNERRFHLFQVDKSRHDKSFILPHSVTSHWAIISVAKWKEVIKHFYFLFTTNSLLTH